MPRPTSAQRGYTYEHQQLRKRVARQVERGEGHCWRCLEEGKTKEQAWIPPGSDWDLGHDDQDRTRYRGPEHATCNRATTRRKPQRQRPAEGHPGLIDN